MITIYRGDTADIKISITENESNFDLTGYTGKFLMKHSADSKFIYANLQHDHDKSDLINGQLVFLIDKTLSEKLPIGSHRYSVIIEKADYRRTVRIGEFRVNDSLIAADPDSVYPVR